MEWDLFIIGVVYQVMACQTLAIDENFLAAFHFPLTGPLIFSIIDGQVDKVSFQDFLFSLFAFHFFTIFTLRLHHIYGFRVRDLEILFHITFQSQTEITFEIFVPLVEIVDDHERELMA